MQVADDGVICVIASADQLDACKKHARTADRKLNIRHSPPVRASADEQQRSPVKSDGLFLICHYNRILLQCRAETVDYTEMVF